MSRHALLAVTACALVAFTFAAACSDEPEPAEFVCTPLPTECTGEAPSYASVIAPIIANNCSQCHYEGNPDGDWPLDDLSLIVDWRISIQEMLSDCVMPPRDSGVIMNDADREALNAWLVCGAPDN
jgi:hypothetical protein